jgi:hypothetical protein
LFVYLFLTSFSPYFIVNVILCPYTEDELRLQTIASQLSLCGTADILNIQYVKGTIEEYAYSAKTITFDYIEYNGGINSAPYYRRELSLLKTLLSPTGAIGLTFFTKNRVYDTIRSLLAGANATAHLPFSIEKERLVRRYLSMQGFKDRAVKDNSLVAFLSDRKGINSAGFTQREVEEDIDLLGLRIVNWVPKGYSKPFEEFDDYSIQSYRSYGLSQEAFVEELFISFRYSVYITHSNASSSPSLLRVPGPAHLEEASWIADNSDISQSKAVVIDRYGGELSAIFQQGISGKVTSFSFIAAPSVWAQITGNEHHITFFAMADILPALALLSKKPTLKDLFAVIMGKGKTEGERERLLRAHLVKALQFLVKLSFITLWSDGMVISSDSHDMPQVIMSSASFLFCLFVILYPSCLFFCWYSA